MLQNLVNLKPTPSAHGERPSFGATPERGEQRFGQLLSKAQSAVQTEKPTDEEGVPSGAKAEDDLRSEEVEGSEARFGNFDVKLSGQKSAQGQVKLGGLLKNSSADPLALSKPNGSVNTGAEKSVDGMNGDAVTGHPDVAEELLTPVVETFLSGAAIVSAAGDGAIAAKASGTTNAAARTDAILPKLKTPMGHDVAAAAHAAKADADRMDLKPGRVTSSLVSSQNQQSGETGAIRGTTSAGVALGSALAANAAGSPLKPIHKPEISASGKTDIAKNLTSKPVAIEAAVTRLDNELPRMSANQRTAVEGPEDVIRTDRENILMSGRSADAANVKPVNDLMFANLGQPSQSLVTAVKENTTWSKMLSASTVQFTETVKPNGKVLQALNVTLNPIELGKLELNLRMRQGQVTIEVRAESEQAYRSLLVDQDALANNLRGLGFKVDAITINGPQSENGPQFQNSTQSENDNSAAKSESGPSRGESQQSDELDHPSTEATNSDEENTASLNII